MIRILAISGSLRAQSSNTALLRAMSLLAPDEIEIIIYNDTSTLPYFNPDIDPFNDKFVMSFRSQVEHAHGLLIAAPEYAHGLPGAFKNALDWLVGCEKFPGKPVALINASSRAKHAQSSLFEIFKTMSADIVKEASLTIPITPGRELSHEKISASPELSSLINTVLNNLVYRIKNR